jgi:hypothetical protein
LDVLGKEIGLVIVRYYCAEFPESFKESVCAWNAYLKLKYLEHVEFHLQDF